jgi:AraC family transcriptional regulator
MHKQETINYYQNKVNDITSYIKNNLDKDLSVKKLAEKSNISHFHFHRIVRACIGMPLGTYINNLRLDTAAKIIKYSNTNINEIAIKVGYSDLSAFSKSFTREFGITPSDYRANSEIVINSNIDFCFSNSNIEKYNLSPKIKILPDKEIAFIQVKGVYGGSQCDAAWNLLLKYAEKNKLISWNIDVFSIYYDDPEVTGIENCISDLCFSLKKPCAASETVNIKKIAGGKYLTFKYKGPYDNLWDVYDMIFKDLVLLNKYQVRDWPIVERYLKYSSKTKPENAITEICIPIE